MAMSNPIANLFGSSPIKPIQKHMAVVSEAVVHLENLLNDSMQGDWEQAEQHHEYIVANKKDADSIIKELRMNMPKGLFMPMSRNDLLTIIRAQHHLTGLALDISTMVTERQLEMPQKLKSTFKALVSSSVQNNQNAHNAINELDELLETGFSGHEIKVVKKLIKQIDRQLVKVEKNAKKTRLRLQTLEHEISSVDVMFLYKTIKQVTDVARQSKDIGNYLQLLIAK